MNVGGNRKSYLNRISLCPKSCFMNSIVQNIMLDEQQNTWRTTGDCPMPFDNLDFDWYALNNIDYFVRYLFHCLSAGISGDLVSKRRAI